MKTNASKKAALITSLLFLSLALRIFAEKTHSVATVKEASASAQPTSASAQPTLPSLPVMKVSGIGKPWPHETGDMQPDPRAVWGKLDNGVRYVILPTKAAPARASLRLYMDVGSMMETDAERGIAHFLEHMALKGTKHVPAGEMFEHFERLGMKAGADTNAFTDRNETVYQLDLPRANAELLDDGLTYFRDCLDGMLLDEKEINSERGVILSELLYRDSAEARAGNAALQFILPDAQASRRAPIGTAARIRGMTRRQFVDFYETWYTPGRATVVAVGDFDAKQVEHMIAGQFADAKARRGEQPDPAFGKGTLGQGEIAKSFSSPDLTACCVEIDLLGTAIPTAHTVAEQRRQSVGTLALAMLSQRLQKLSTADKSAFQSASAATRPLFDLVQQTSISASCRPEQWPAALGVIEQELRRAQLHGFTTSEFAEMKTAILAAMQAFAEGAETSQPSDLANMILRSLQNKSVLQHPTQVLAMCQRILSEITKEDCQAALRKLCSTPDVRLWVHGNLQPAGDKSEELLAAFHASQKVTVSPPAEETLGRFAYTDFGPAGEIVKRNDQADLGVVEAIFANQVRVNVKRTTLEKNKVCVMLRFGGGLLELPADKPGLRQLANGAFMACGLQAHSLADLNRVTAGKEYGISFIVADDAFQLSGGCTADALETQLQVGAAFLSAPGYRPEGQKQYLDSLENIFGAVEHSAEGAFGNEGLAFLHSHDPRFGIAPRDVMRKLTLDDLKAWLSRPLATGYLEASIVGDIDPEAALKLAAKTVGALPPRDALKPAFTKERALKFPPTPKAKEIPFVSEDSRALSVVCWPTEAGGDETLSHRLDVLAEVFSGRLFQKVRAELGATYTPSVSSSAGSIYRGFGFVEAQMVIEAKQLAPIGELVVKLGAELAAGSITDDEFQRALKPILSSFDESAKNNGYWLWIISDCQEHSETLDNERNLLKDYQSITKAEIEALAKRFLTADQATIISMKPTAAGKK